MDLRILRRIAHPLIFAAGFMPCTAHADIDWFAMPSLSVVQLYDDNLFSSVTQQEDDRVLQSSPALEAGCRSAPLTLYGRYSIDAENYAEHSELDRERARERAVMDFRYEATRRAILTTDGNYTKTNRPGELNPDTGVESGRASAEGFSLHPGLAYRLDSRTIGATGYAYTQEKLAGSPGTDTHTVTLGFDRDLSRRDTLRLGYVYRKFLFEGQGDVSAHSFTGGATHDFTPRTSGTLMGGPRFSEGTVDPEISVAVLHLLEPGELSFSYGRGLSTTIGQAGAVTTETVGATALYPIGRALEFRAAASWFSSARGDFRADVQRVGLEMSYRIANPVSVIGSYQSSVQKGSLDTSGGAEITRTVLMLGIVLAAPARSRMEPRTPDGMSRSPSGEPRP